MSALVAPSGECLRGDGRCADRIVSNLAPLYLAAYLRVLNPAVDCAWPVCDSVYSAFPRVSFVAFCLRIIKLMIFSYKAKS